MVTTDQLEILLRSIPQYFLFAALSLFIFGWIEKKNLYGAIAEALVAVLGLGAIVVFLGDMIPSPRAEGLNQEHVEMVIKLIFMLSLNGILATASLIVRAFKKTPFKVLVFTSFALALFIFFYSTRLSKVKFELNTTTETIAE